MPDLVTPELVKTIKKNATNLTFPEVFVVDDTLEPVDPQIFLAAFSLNESSGGYDKKACFEKAYAPGGKYCTGKQYELWNEYGNRASCSYSSFQLMFICFYEMGFAPTPLQAGNDEYALPVVVKFFNKRVLKRTLNFLCQAGDAYNSGNTRDNNVPEEYIKKLLKHYHKAINSELFDITIDRNAPKPW